MPPVRVCQSLERIRSWCGVSAFHSMREIALRNLANFTSLLQDDSKYTLVSGMTYFDPDHSLLSE